MLRDLSALAPCSLLADCAHVIGMMVVLKDDVEQFNIAHETLVLSKGAAALPFLFGVSIYCYEGISMILPLEESMAEKSKVLRYMLSTDRPLQSSAQRCGVSISGC